MKSLLYFIGLYWFSIACWAIESQSVTSVVLARTTRSWDGTALPGYLQGQPEVTILKITIPPKTRVPMHKHSVINAGVMLTGTLKVVSDDGKILLLKPGDSIVELVNKWHYGENEGDDPVQILVFYAGVEGVPVSSKQACEDKAC